MPGINGPPGITVVLLLKIPSSGTIGPRGKKGKDGYPGEKGDGGLDGPIGEQGEEGNKGVCPTYCATDGGVFFIQPADWLLGN